MQKSAPSTQVNITDDMVDAGCDALSRFWVDLTTSETALSLFPETVSAIYRAMEGALNSKLYNHQEST